MTRKGGNVVEFFHLFCLSEILSPFPFQLFSYTRESPAYANLLRQGYEGQEASAGKPAYGNLLRQGYEGQEASAGR
jgi:hypothetical protein